MPNIKSKIRQIWKILLSSTKAAQANQGNPIRTQYSILEAWPDKTSSSWDTEEILERYKRDLVSIQAETILDGSDQSWSANITRDTLRLLGAIDVPQATLLDVGCSNPSRCRLLQCENQDRAGGDSGILAMGLPWMRHQRANHGLLSAGTSK